MVQDLILWFLVVLYMHIIRYSELVFYTNVRNLRDYFNYRHNIILVILFTQIMIFVAYELLKLNS